MVVDSRLSPNTPGHEDNSKHAKPKLFTITEEFCAESESNDGNISAQRSSRTTNGTVSGGLNSQDNPSPERRRKPRPTSPRHARVRASSPTKQGHFGRGDERHQPNPQTILTSNPVEVQRKMLMKQSSIRRNINLGDSSDDDTAIGTDELGPMKQTSSRNISGGDIQSQQDLPERRATLVRQTNFGPGHGDPQPEQRRQPQSSYPASISNNVASQSRLDPNPLLPASNQAQPPPTSELRGESPLRPSSGRKMRARQREDLEIMEEEPRQPYPAAMSERRLASPLRHANQMPNPEIAEEQETSERRPASLVRQSASFRNSQPNPIPNSEIMEGRAQESHPAPTSERRHASPVRQKPSLRYSEARQIANPDIMEGQQASERRHASPVRQNTSQRYSDAKQIPNSEIMEGQAQESYPAVTSEQRDTSQNRQNSSLPYSGAHQTPKPGIREGQETSERRQASLVRQNSSFRYSEANQTPNPGIMEGQEISERRRPSPVRQNSSFRYSEASQIPNPGIMEGHETSERMRPSPVRQNSSFRYSEANQTPNPGIMEGQPTSERMRPSPVRQNSSFRYSEASQIPNPGIMEGQPTSERMRPSPVRQNSSFRYSEASQIPNPEIVDGQGQDAHPAPTSERRHASPVRRNTALRYSEANNSEIMEGRAQESHPALTSERRHASPMRHSTSHRYSEANQTPHPEIMEGQAQESHPGMASERRRKSPHRNPRVNQTHHANMMAEQSHPGPTSDRRRTSPQRQSWAKQTHQPEIMEGQEHESHPSPTSERRWASPQRQTSNGNLEGKQTHHPEIMEGQGQESHPGPTSERRWASPHKQISYGNLEGKQPHHPEIMDGQAQESHPGPKSEQRWASPPKQTSYGNLEGKQTHHPEIMEEQVNQPYPVAAASEPRSVQPERQTSSQRMEANQARDADIVDGTTQQSEPPLTSERRWMSPLRSSTRKKVETQTNNQEIMEGQADDPRPAQKPERRWASPLRQSRVKQGQHPEIIERQAEEPHPASTPGHETIEGQVPQSRPSATSEGRQTSPIRSSLTKHSETIDGQEQQAHPAPTAEQRWASPSGQTSSRNMGTKQTTDPEITEGQQHQPHPAPKSARRWVSPLRHSRVKQTHLPEILEEPAQESHPASISQLGSLKQAPDREIVERQSHPSHPSQTSERRPASPVRHSLAKQTNHTEIMVGQEQQPHPAPTAEQRRASPQRQAAFRNGGSAAATSRSGVEENTAMESKTENSSLRPAEGVPEKNGVDSASLPMTTQQKIRKKKAPSDGTPSLADEDTKTDDSNELSPSSSNQSGSGLSGKLSLESITEKIGDESDGPQLTKRQKSRKKNVASSSSQADYENKADDSNEFNCSSFNLSSSGLLEKLGPESFTEKNGIESASTQLTTPHKIRKKKLSSRGTPLQADEQNKMDDDNELTPTSINRSGGGSSLKLSPESVSEIDGAISALDQITAQQKTRKKKVSSRGTPSHGDLDNETKGISTLAPSLFSKSTSGVLGDPSPETIVPTATTPKIRKKKPVSLGPSLSVLSAELKTDDVVMEDGEKSTAASLPPMHLTNRGTGISNDGDSSRSRGKRSTRLSKFLPSSRETDEEKERDNDNKTFSAFSVNQRASGVLRNLSPESSVPTPSTEQAQRMKPISLAILDEEYKPNVEMDDGEKSASASLPPMPITNSGTEIRNDVPSSPSQGRRRTRLSKFLPSSRGPDDENETDNDNKTFSAFSVNQRASGVLGKLGSESNAPTTTPPHIRNPVSLGPALSVTGEEYRTDDTTEDGEKSVAASLPPMPLSKSGPGIRNDVRTSPSRGRRRARLSKFLPSSEAGEENEPDNDNKTFSAFSVNQRASGVVGKLDSESSAPKATPQQMRKPISLGPSLSVLDGEDKQDVTIGDGEKSVAASLPPVPIISSRTGVADDVDSSPSRGKRRTRLSKFLPSSRGTAEEDEADMDNKTFSAFSVNRSGALGKLSIPKLRMNKAVTNGDAEFKSDVEVPLSPRALTESLSPMRASSPGSGITPSYFNGTTSTGNDDLPSSPSRWKRGVRLTQFLPASPFKPKRIGSSDDSDDNRDLLSTSKESSRSSRSIGVMDFGDITKSIPLPSLLG